MSGTAQRTLPAPWSSAPPLASAGRAGVTVRAPVGVLLMLASAMVSVSLLWWAGRMVIAQLGV